MMRLLTFLVVPLALVIGSSVSGGEFRRVPAARTSGLERPVISSPDDCAIAVGRSRSQMAVGPMQRAIRVLNWNIQKKSGREIKSDIALFGADADLLLLQETSLGGNEPAPITGEFHQAFAPGYRSRRAHTGVMTASKSPPLTQCSFQSVEPWLRSPKATNVTQYSLAGREDTLVVINLHLINFTLGVRAMQRQLSEALQVIEGHRGPVIVSGDFNTWSAPRAASVERVLQRFGLDAVRYEADRRKRVFGRALDHVYVRGMQVVNSTSHESDRSDHNPMLIDLRLLDPTDDAAGGDVDAI
jgi:endonuclease/exonuclease/phosphatase (EEP) superfamily protein YafD